MRKINPLVKILLVISFILVAWALWQTFGDADGPIKLIPEFKGADLKSKFYKKYFMRMAEDKGLYFKDNIPIGFKNINSGQIIGECWYLDDKREIIFDTSFWDKATEVQKIALSFHEFAHCYCDRDHDFGSGKRYPETRIGILFNRFLHLASNKPIPGYMEDGCPLSLMHPSLPSQSCLDMHFIEYLDEVFNRCKAW